MLSSARAAVLKPVLARLYRECDASTPPADPIEKRQGLRGSGRPGDRGVHRRRAWPSAEWRAFSLPSIAVLGRPRAVARGVRARVRPGRDSRGPWRPFVHRWTRGQRHRGVAVHPAADARHRRVASKRFFLEGDDPAAPDIGPGLESFCARARDVDLRPVYGRRMAARPGPMLLPASVGRQRLQAPESVSAGGWCAGTGLTSVRGRACHRRASSSPSTCTSSGWGSVSG